MDIEKKLADCLIFGGMEVAKKLPTQLLRFIGVFVAFFVMLLCAPIWMPLVIFAGLRDVWNDVK